MNTLIVTIVYDDSMTEAEITDGLNEHFLSVAAGSDWIEDPTTGGYQEFDWCYGPLRLSNEAFARKAT